MGKLLFMHTKGNLIFNAQIVELLDDFKPKSDEPTRSARRPARGSLLIETTTFEHRTDFYQGLADFWLHALLGFQNDTGTDNRWFEGLAYQSCFQELDAPTFEQEYSKIQKNLTLPPPGIAELQRAYRVLEGRVNSFCGITSDGEYWAGTFGPAYFD